MTLSCFPGVGSLIQSIKPPSTWTSMLYCIITSENFFKHAFLCAIIKHCASLWFTTFLYMSCIRLVVPKTVQFLSEMSAVLNWKYWITVQTQLSFGLKITPWRNECEILLCNQPPRPNQFPTFDGTGKWVLVKMQWCSTGEEQRQIWLVSHTWINCARLASKTL